MTDSSGIVNDTTLRQLVAAVNSIVDRYVTAARGDAAYRRAKRPVALEKLRIARQSLTHLAQAASPELAERARAQCQRLDRVINLVEVWDADSAASTRPDISRTITALMADKAPVRARPANDGVNRRRRMVAVITFACMITGIAVFWWVDGQRQLALMLHSSDEDALMQYVMDNAGNSRGERALVRYLALMDSLMADSAQMSRSSQYPVLVKMDNLARNRSLPDDIAGRISAWVAGRADSLYAQARASNTLAAWTVYQSRVPDAYLRDAQERIDSLEQVVWSSDDTAWAEVRAAGDRGMYERYIDTFPQGTHVRQARAHLIDIEVSAYRNRGNSIIQSIDRLADSPGPTSQVVVYNDTEYAMEFLFSGPTSDRMAIAPHTDAQLTLDNGSYRVLVLLDNAARDRFCFTQTFDSGLYGSTLSIAQ